MQKFKKIHPLDPDKNVSQTERHKDRWTDEQK